MFLCLFFSSSGQQNKLNIWFYQDGTLRNWGRTWLPRMERGSFMQSLTSKTRGRAEVILAPTGALYSASIPFPFFTEAKMLYLMSELWKIYRLPILFKFSTTYGNFWELLPNLGNFCHLLFTGRLNKIF